MTAGRDPQGGTIRRKPGTREPSGVMEGTVLIKEFLRIMPKLSPQQHMALLEAGQDMYARYGHTTAQEGRALPGNVDLYVAAARAGKLKLDTVVYPRSCSSARRIMNGPPAAVSRPLAHRRREARRRLTAGPDRVAVAAHHAPASRPATPATPQ
jgi:hypothetical protein